MRVLWTPERIEALLPPVLRERWRGREVERIKWARHCAVVHGTTLEEELAAPPELSPEETRVILSTVGDVLDRAEPEELRTIVETLIEAIVIDGDDITIKWRFS